MSTMHLIWTCVNTFKYATYIIGAFFENALMYKKLIFVRIQKNKRTTVIIHQEPAQKQPFSDFGRGLVSKHQFPRKFPIIFWIFALLHQNNASFSIWCMSEIHRRNVESRSRWFRLMLNFQSGLWKLFKLAVNY